MKYIGENEIMALAAEYHAAARIPSVPGTDPAAYAAWRALRLAVAGPACREVGWYYYSRNGSSAASRDGGTVARQILFLAGGRPSQLPSASWCSKYRRTKSSERAEEQGVDACDDALATVARWHAERQSAGYRNLVMQGR